MKIITLADGNQIELHSSRHYYPPDHKGMAPATSSWWIKYENKWYPTRDFLTRSIIKLQIELTNMTIDDIKKVGYWGEEK